MSEETAALLKKALTLSVEERTELAGSRTDSLDSTTDEDVEAAWQEEIARRMENLRFERAGFTIIRNCLPDELVFHLRSILPESQPNTRNALSIPVIAELARSQTIRKWVVPVLGEGCFAVRAILFNKNQNSNWKVAWHQDCVIAVRSRAEIPGWGPWTLKAGVPHVRPPDAILARMLAIRIHLDDCGADNGPLRMLPGSHIHGLLSDFAIAALPKNSEIVCATNRGDALLMRPLVVHASSAARSPASRRVIHIEFASDYLPHGLNWRDEVSGTRP